MKALQINTEQNNNHNVSAFLGLADRRDFECLRKVVRTFAPNTTGLRALDLECGHGITSLALAEMGFEVAAMNAYRSSYSSLQEVVVANGLNIFFGKGGIAQMLMIEQKFDLIHDREILTNTISTKDRSLFLSAVATTLEYGGVFVLKTEIWSQDYDPQDSFESLRLDAAGVIWRQTPASDAPGVVEMDGRHWTAQKRLLPADAIREELSAAGFEVLTEEIECVVGTKPSVIRLALTKR